jgi:hypothetical protein
VPRVEDKVGLVVQEHFERFLDSWVFHPS